MGSKTVVGILAALAVVAAAFVLLHENLPRDAARALSPCDHPLQYRIGRVDSSFQTTKDELLEAARQAAGVWDQAAGRKLFEYNERAPSTVNLVYDERQRMTEERERMAWRHEEDQARYNELKTRYDSMKADYDARLSSYNSEVQDANRQGRVPRETYDRLQRDRVDLRTTLDSINSLAGQLNALAWSDKTDTAQYNENAEKKFAAGDCAKSGDGGEVKISIYQFKNRQDFALKLAHEFGHALGLNHVPNPKSVMYYMIRDQDATNISLSPEDKAALQAACGQR